VEPPASEHARSDLPDSLFRTPATPKVAVEGVSYMPPRTDKPGRGVFLPRGWFGRHDVAGRGGSAWRGDAKAHLILDNVSFAVAPGHVFTVLGPSGSGKSTLLRTIDRLIEPTSGRVLLDGRPAADLPVQQLRRRVGMVFQTAALFDGTVMDNVLYGPRLRAGDERAPDDTQAGWSSGRDRDAAHDQASGLLRRVGLPESFCDKPVDELSGGEAQRVSLARALANEPEVLLLDEPTAALDPSSSQLIEDLLEQLSGETELTFIFVTHNLPQARRIGDHGLLLVDGRVVDAGPLPGFLDDPTSEVTHRFVMGTSLEQRP
jgi:putative ABC transport system ATP-binding protein